MNLNDLRTRTARMSGLSTTVADDLIGTVPKADHPRILVPRPSIYLP